MSDRQHQISQQSCVEITPQALSNLGLNQIAFIKSVHEEGEEHFVVHSADGTAVRLFPTRELAELAIRHSDLLPVSLH
ncbi:hypothetical protein P856_258 [Candidatus Endolissoclinum faulkneri L5]|uniref:DUF1150 family protein n=1 Tax=Candidatus Endolissoclinum faulkneri L5 TaxID=1401328 RepID=V9TTJ4_9PROT|nr:DUF1150 family protein [Candidatus Endolissoclinum faulkneri]AHC73487.1 hypothetical protein P856_258 [Candidatus Endolissoclinum faulkneri L5]